MKKFLFTLIILLPVVAIAENVNIDGICYNLVQKKQTAEVVKPINGNYSGYIIIPECFVFDDLTYTVTSIGAGAFYGSSGLDSVSIPNTVTSIEKSAFGNCQRITSISIPNSVTYIGEKAFAYCKNLLSCCIPTGITILERGIFTGCKNLKTVTIPNSVMSIEESAFYDCRSLVSANIPENVTTIKDYAFQNCSCLTTLTLPNSLISIGNCAFLGCTSATIVTIPNSVTSMGHGAFSGCNNIISAVVSNNLNNIQYETFYGCTNLKTLIIGNSTKKISNKAFSNCPNLENVYCYAKIVPITDNTAFEDSFVEYATLHVPNSSINAYKETTPWKDFKEIVKIDMPKHHITYIIDGNEYKSYEVEEDEYITPEPDPTKEGFSFSGWSEIPEVMPDHDVTVTGSFIVNKYKLTYQINGEDYKTYKIEYGATINPEPEPTKEGYTFSGWSWIPSKMPAEDVVVTGSFTANKYKLTYMVDGSEYRVYNIECGSVITPEPAPFKDGYEFSGWSDLPEIMPAHDVTVTGTFTYLPPCEAPIISYENGNLIFECATEGVEFVSDITDSDIKTHYKAIIPLSATYTIKVYAQKEGYKKSEAVTATLCWIDSTPSMEGIENTKMTEIHSIPVLIHAQDGRISIDGIDNGITVSAYTISGFKAGMEKGKDGKAEIITTMQKGETAIVKIGEKAVKVMMQ